MANYTNAYDQLMRNFRTLLLNLRRQIAAREAELKRLRDEEHNVRPAAGRQAGRRIRARGRRTDWQAVLAKLPKQFKAADIRKVPQAASKRSSEVFAGDYAPDRSEGGEAEGRGVYQKK